MKLKPSTIVLAVVATILGGAVYLSQIDGPTRSENQANQATQNLFTFEEQQVTAFTLKTQLRSLAFAKDDDGTWQMKEPDTVPANAASIAYLLNLIVAAEGERPFTVSAEQQADFGFHQPLATIDLTLDNQNHRLIIGGYNFDRSRLYAQVDPPAEAGKPLNVVLVPPEFDAAVNRALPEWKGEE